MSRRLKLSVPVTVLVGAASGVVASWVKVLVEAPMQRQAERIWPPAPGQKDLVGADPAGQPERMPPAVIAGATWKRVTGEQLGTEELLKVQSVIHYAFGAGIGIVYALLARQLPIVTRGLGAPAGAGVYATTHASLVPALGVQEYPPRLPKAAVAWEGGSHVVFGIALELSRSLLSGPAR